MAVTLVNKTIFTNPSNLTSGSFNLSAPSTPGNWLILACVYKATGSKLLTATTDQGENLLAGTFPEVTGVTDALLEMNYLLTTKSCTTISWTTVSSTVMTFAVYEVSGNSMTFYNNDGFAGSGSLSTGNIGGRPSEYATFYFAMAMGDTPDVVNGVSSPFTLDTLAVLGSSAIAGVATYVGTGVQNATFTATPATGLLANLWLLLYETSPASVSTTTTLTSNIDPSIVNQSVTFTAQVFGSGGSGNPTGTVTFSVDGINVAVVAVVAGATSHASATYSTAGLALGNHAIGAVYSGDSTYLTSAATPIIQIVQQQCPFPFSTALQELANRLYDPTMQFWTQAELIYYMQEAFRTWNALTSYWRGDFTLPSTQGSVFYDITNVTTAPNTLRPLTITDAYLYTIIEYHLLEPPVGSGPWTGSLQFNLDDILNAVQRRHNECLSVTGCNVAHSTANAAPDRIYMLNTVLDIRRVAYISESGAISPMFQDDTWGVQAFTPSYTTAPPGIPSIYRVSTEPLLSFDADVPPLPGQYDLLTLNAGTPLTLATPNTFLIPDDWTWVLKWGSLADLLSKESNAKDLLRAKYCEGRYKQGMQLLAAASALLAMRVDNIPLQVDAIHSADLYNPTWQGQPQGSPSMALVAGLNLIALSPPSNAGPYSLTLTVVENAPVPVNPSDCLQITQDVYDVLLDYSQHLAAFKMGGAEFLATASLFQRFMEMAALYSSKLSEQGEFTKILYGLSQQDMNINPRYSADADPASGGDQ